MVPMQGFFAPPSPAYSSRREFLTRAGSGFGMLALAGLLGQENLLAQTGPTSRLPMAPRPGHFPARAKSVIWLFMNGGPSPAATRGYKPQPDRPHGHALAGLR